MLGFISRNEFSDIIKLILYGENGTGDVNEAYVEELTSAMDFDKNGKIDFNEFLGKYNLLHMMMMMSIICSCLLESFRIVNVKRPTKSKKKSSSTTNGTTVNEHQIRV